MAQTFQAGASKTDITPPLGTLINGDFVTHYATRIHDRLYSKALVLSNAQTTLIIVMVDICAMDRDFLDEVKNKIYADTAIPVENILIASTHTHFGGSIVDLLVGAADLSYRKILGKRILESVIQALRNIRPAKAGFTSTDVPEHVMCRRYYMKPGYAARNPVTGGLDLIKTNPVGDEQQIENISTTVDAGLGLFAVKGMDDKWISVLGNYSMHYVGDCENGTITADYFGVFSNQIAKLLNAGEEFVGMMSNGTSGEVNVWDFLNRNKYPSGFHEKTALIGTELAEKAALALNDMNFDSNPVLSSQFQLKELSLRKPNHEELEAAKRIVSAARFEALEVNHEGYEALVKVYAREQILLNEYPDSKLFPIQALRIGDGVIGGLGGEFFSETGLKLKKESGASNYFTICMANDYVGYVPPAHEIEKGGYETWRCRTSHLAAESESIIRNTLTDMIQSLANPAQS